MSKKNGHTPKDAATKSRQHDTSAKAQRQQLLNELETKQAEGVDTIYARDYMGIMAPAPRIKELRERGFSIQTFREDIADSLGVIHRGVARYVLIAGGGQ